MSSSVNFNPFNFAEISTEISEKLFYIFLRKIQKAYIYRQRVTRHTESPKGNHCHYSGASYVGFVCYACYECRLYVMDVMYVMYVKQLCYVICKLCNMQVCQLWIMSISSCSSFVCHYIVIITMCIFCMHHHALHPHVMWIMM